jgi:hypothetical protein
MAENNYINSGVSNNDLISLAGQLQASKLAVPEKTTWDYIQEDLEEWQVAVKGRAAKFMEDLPEEFDLNKVEPEGRDAISSWYKTMRKDFMKAANNAALFDPGSFAYGDGASKMNKIEDNLSAVNGVFDNIKAVRTQAIKDKDNYASGVPESQKSMMNAIVSGEMFKGMVIKDGSIQFKVEGATYPKGQDYFTEEDIKSLRTKGSLSEEGINAIIANAEEDMFNGIAFKDGTYRSTIVKALNSGKKTGENQDLMLDVGGINEDGSLNAEPYVTKWLNASQGDANFPDLKSIKENLSEFYNQNEDDFIDNFLMANARRVHKNTDMGEQAELELEKKKKALELQDQQISASQTDQANTRSIMRERDSKNKNNARIEQDIEKQSAFANDLLEKGGGTFNYNGYKVVPTEKEGGYNVKKDGMPDFIAKNEDDLRGYLMLPRTEAGEARQVEIREQKKDDYATAVYALADMVEQKPIISDPNKVDSIGRELETAYSAGPSQTLSFIKTNFGDTSIKSKQVDGDVINLTINGASKNFITNRWNSGRNKKHALGMMQWISDNLNK